MTVVHVLIRWSLLGCYICFTTSFDTVDIYLLLRLCTTCRIPNYCYWLWTVSTNCRTDSLYCTVQGLKYVPVASIIGCQFWEPDWVSADDLWWGSQLWCNQQFGRCLFGTVHGTSLKNLWQWRQNPQKGDSTNSATIHQTSQTYVITRKQLVLCHNLPTWVDFGKIDTEKTWKT